MFCLCGCGLEIPLISWGRKLRFKHGHHIKGKNNPRWNKGIKDMSDRKCHDRYKYNITKQTIF